MVSKNVGYYIDCCSIDSLFCGESRPEAVWGTALLGKFILVPCAAVSLVLLFGPLLLSNLAICGSSSVSAVRYLCYLD